MIATSRPRPRPPVVTPVLGKHTETLIALTAIVTGLRKLYRRSINLHFGFCIRAQDEWLVVADLTI